MDPFSVTTGVVALLGACVKVGAELKKFHDDVGSVNDTLSGMLEDVNALIRVLNAMRATFDGMPKPITGHIGTHWENITCSLKDGKDALTGLREVVNSVNKDVSILSGPRKQVRLKSAEAKISQFRHHLQSFRDTLQLSMQALILWNQVSTQGARDTIMPNLESLQRDVRSLAIGINSRITSLEAMVNNGEEQEKAEGLTQIVALNNLKSCVHSAASIVSSASTILDRDRETAYLRSDFGDVFLPETNDAMLAWISSSALISVSTSEDTSQPQQRAQDGQVVKEIQFSTGEISDSDSDLDAELALGLYRKGQAKFRAADYRGAEPLLRNCLSRLRATTHSGEKNPRKSNFISIHEVLALLCQSCMRLEKWDEAASAMMDKIALSPRGLEAKDEASLNDISCLVTILYAKKDYVQGHLYARKLLRGYRKLRAQGAEGVERTLILLVEICKASGNTDEGEAYSIMLEDVLDRKATEAAKVAAPTDEQTPAQTSVGTRNEDSALANPTHGNRSYVDALASATEGAEPAVLPTEALATQLSPLRPPSPNTTPTKAPIGVTVARAANTAPVTSVMSSKTYLYQRKLVIVGDGACGKSLLLYHQSRGNIDAVINIYHLTSILETYFCTVQLPNKTVEFTMHDTPGQEDYDRLRPLSYPGSNVALIVFSKDSPDSLDNVMEKWYAEVRHFLPGTPIILVGNKKDLENNPKTIRELQKTSQHPVTYVEGTEVAKRIGAKQYIECSARTGEGISELFESAAEYATIREERPGIFRRLLRRKA